MVKTFRLLSILTLMLVVAAPAYASGINIIFDPPPAPPQVGNLYILTGPGPFAVSFGSCDPSVNPAIPVALQGFAGCMAFLNETGMPVGDVNLSFVVPNDSPLIGQTLGCTSLDAFLSSNTCDQIGALSAGQTVNFDFLGGMGVPNFSAFFIAEDGALLPPLDIAVPAYDPNTLVLLGTGIALMAAFAMRRSA
jgi:hypothetical protein